MKEYIGVLDSGVGGLSVLAELNRLMPQNNYIYFGDTKNIPYGTKKKEEIFNYTKNILDFFLTKNVKNIVFACNTTSAVAYEELKKTFEGRLNIFPLIQSITKNAIEGLKDSDTIVVLATKATINSKKYEEEIKKINPLIKVFSLDCTGFVEIVEQRLYEDKSSIALIESKLNLVKESGAKRAILGCTHYPYLVPLFKKFLDIEYFNPAKSLAKIVQKNINIKGEGEKKFFVSKDPKEFILSAKTFFEVDKAELINL